MIGWLMSRRQRQIKAQRIARAYLKQERAYYREIRRLYRAWLNDTIKRLSRVINPQFRLDADIDPLDLNPLTEAGYVQAGAAISRAELLAPLLDDALSELRARVQRFRIRIDQAAEDIAKISNAVWTDENPIDLLVRPLARDPFLEAELKDFAVKNSRLITKMGEETLDRIGDAALDTLKKSEGRKALAAKIREIDKTIGENRAKLIARNELGKLQSNLTEVRAKRAGVTEYEWQTVGDNRVRPKHAALDGKIRKFGEGIAPGSEINCRCISLIITD